MSLTSDHLERFLNRILLLDERRLEELAATSVDPGRIAPLLTLPALMLPVTDPLTGLPNRRAIVGLAEREFRLMLVLSTPLTLILFDVDDMKKLNARFMLSGGDAVLAQLSGLLANTLLRNEFIGRFGGDRFLIVAPNTNAYQAEALAKRIDDAIRHKKFEFKGEAIGITVSLGVATTDDGTTYPPAKHDFPEGGVSDELLPMIMAATENMDEAKRRLRPTQATRAELLQRLRDSLAVTEDECCPDHVLFSDGNAAVEAQTIQGQCACVPYTSPASSPPSQGADAEAVALIVLNGAFAQLMRVVLALAGFRVLTARLGSEAVSVYQEHQSKIDLVLLNYGRASTNERDGPTTFDALRAINPAVRCAFMSAGFLPDVKTELMDRGAVGLIEKPFQIPDVVRSLREWIRR